MPDVEQMVRRQQVLADFGEFALRSDDLDEVLTEACRLVAETMGTKRAKILEIQDGGRSLLVRSGVGWNPDTVGRVRLDMTERSSESFSIDAGKAVVTRDIREESRFDVPDFMKEAGVIALANVPIFLPGGKAYGLLQVDDVEPRDFGHGVTEFLRTYATILGPVIDRLHQVYKLRTAEERFRLIVETARDYAIFTTDAEGLITGWFPGAEAIFGWTATEAVGQTVSILFTPEDRESHADENELETARVVGVAPNVRWHLCKDGTRVFIDGSNRALRGVGGELHGFFKIGQDITERRNVEVRLQGSEARQRALIEALPQLVWRSAKDGRWTWAGPQWVAYTGLSAEFSRGLGWLNALHPDDRQAAGDAWAMADQSGLFQADYRIRHATSGRYAWFQTRAMPVQDEDGQVIEWIGASTDIEDQVLARNVLARDREELEALVIVRTTELMKAEDALRQSQKMEAVGQLTGGVAHDFNNLLTVIKSSTALLKRPDLTEERRARYVDAISTTADRAAKLTGQLLAFARRQALKPEVFAACESVRALFDMMGTLTGSRIEIVTELSEHPSYVDADRSQFDTALVNLAVNARDAMDGEGSINIKVQAVDAIPAIRAHASIEGAYVAISLRDTGSGIPADVVERIFEPFFTTKETGKGTGLGLSQVFGFAKQSGGDTSVVSTVGAGTTFTLYLPRVAAPPSATAIEKREAYVDGHGTRVLVVEDNVDVGAFTMQSLSDLGYETVHAADGAAALAELRKAPNRFDVVFSDVMMPGMSGIELGREVRRLYRDLPVVLTSGYSHVLVQNGTCGFELLHKPYSIEQLSQVLHRQRLGSGTDEQGTS